MTCGACGSENRTGRRFCAQCGAPLELTCASCGATNEPGDRFCGDCGAPLTAAAAAPVVPAAPERRLVSVLFADLVGFTALSEHRDPEDVSELMSQYFDRCRTTIERFGGTVVKFIGDAVMAVWGSPVAREDDAERAVRAALSLTRAIIVLGEEVGMPDLRVRAGVLTGHAAVEVGAEGEGMILGDSVNTASRLQSLAMPGTVLVDESTRRASEAAIAYEDAGTHHVKGREQPVRAFQALRIVAGSGGERRSVGVEAPFVGRDNELQAIIDASEATSREGRARHISIVGEAGSGKTRLLWEYFKYISGLEELFYWHQGRCLSYGEGVGYWALAEIVRSRAGIVEDEAPASAREKLRATVEEYVPDERERRMVEPRLAHLLRLEERPDADRADLFSGWRLFFERMAQSSPVVLAFEDLQWAESGLLDFIDYLLEWSADFPILVMTIARPELAARRPGWQLLQLEPLPPTAVAAMLDGLAPGLPDEVVADVTARADGIPLYVVETIRMLQDRGVLVAEGDRYRVEGDLSDIDVPESLHALVASRLDGLSPAERSLLQDASVLGQSFSALAAAELSGRTEAEVTQLLDGLVAKQVLARDDDPRSPERGQYVFLQTLLRTVAYGTLSKHVRKSRHVAAARQLQRSWPGEAHDIAEVLASHYLEAIRADPEADDVAALRAAARDRLIDAGRAAASLALGPEAQRYFEHAAELAVEDTERAGLFHQAGLALRQSGDLRAAEEQFRRSIDLAARDGSSSGAPAAVALSNLLRYVGRVDEALAVLEPFVGEADAPTDPILRAEIGMAYGTALANTDRMAEAAPFLEGSLAVLEREQAWAQLSEALIGRGTYLLINGRYQEGIAVLRHTLTLSTEHDLPSVALRAHFNLAAVALSSDRFDDAVSEVERGLAIARERGDRPWEMALLAQLVPPFATLGRWSECVAAAEQVLGGGADINALFAAPWIVALAAARDDHELLERWRALGEGRQGSSHIDERIVLMVLSAQDALDGGNAEDAFRLARSAVELPTSGAEVLESAYGIAVQAALELAGDAELTDLIELVDRRPRAEATALFRAGRARLRAEQAQRAGDERAAESCEQEAIALLRAIGARPLLAQALLERTRRRGDAAALEEARMICADLGATRWLARISEAEGLAA